jgi:hypothetical protein
MMPNKKHDVGNGLIDDNSVSRSYGRPCTRIAQRMPYIRSDDECSEDYRGRSLWNLFARVKYWARDNHGPRDSGTRREDLQKAAIILRDALEMTWRAGFRGDDLADAMLTSLKAPVVETVQEFFM